MGRKKFKNITSKFCFKEIVKGPTRITRSSETQIDLIFTNKTDHVLKTFNMIKGLSGHNLTLVVRKLTKKRFSHQTMNRKTWNFRILKNDLKHLKRVLEDIK